MATITTTIKEPKTFQQIQDQQKELEKEEALETLNNNIAKLIKTINEKSEKKISDDEKQLKANQLALSKLQLQRAKLGLAKEEKSYSDYSVKYNSTHGIGSSIGVSQNSRDNATAIALSAVTAGALNPVIIKDVLLPPLKMMTRAVTGVAKALISGFSGRRISGKSSSAVESYEKNRLHKKLDDILGAIKNKTKSSPKEEKKEKGVLSKIIGSILGLVGTVGRYLLGALKGLLAGYLLAKLGEKIGPMLEGFLTKVVGREATGAIVDLVKRIGPEMAAGYMIAGWKGAVIAGGLKLAYDWWQEFEREEDEVKGHGRIVTDKTAIFLNKYLPDFLKFKDNKHFYATASGMMLGGFKGMVVGWLVGRYADTIRDFAKDVSGPEEGEVNESNWKNKLGEYLEFLGLGNAETIIPMMAGLYGAGVKGLIFGYAVGQIAHLKTLVDEQKEAIKIGDEITADEIQGKIEDAKFRALLSGALTGLTFGGISGAIIGGIIGYAGSEYTAALVKYGNAKVAYDAAIEKSYFGIPATAWVTSLGLAALALKSGLGIPGALAGAALGFLGGFIADRMRTKEIIEKMGFETEFSGLNYVIKGHENIDVLSLRQKAREDILSEKIKAGEEKPEVTEEEINERVISDLKKQGVQSLSDMAKETTQTYEKKKKIVGDKQNDIVDAMFLDTQEAKDINDRDEAFWKSTDYLDNFLYRKGLLEKSFWRSVNPLDPRKYKVIEDEDQQNKITKFLKENYSDSGITDEHIKQTLLYLAKPIGGEYNKDLVHETIKIINNKNEAEVDQANRDQIEREKNNSSYLETIAKDAQQRIDEREKNKNKKEEPVKFVIENEGGSSSEGTGSVSTGFGSFNVNGDNKDGM